MIFAQVTTAWTELLNHSVAIAVLAFVGTTLTWWIRRTYGKDGTETKRVEIQSDCEMKNTATMATNSITLVELKNLSASQQDLCSRHAGGLQRVGDELVQMSKGIQDNKTAAEHFELLYKSPRHYKTTYLIDLAGELVDTFARIAKSNGLDIDSDLEMLRAKVVEAKAHMHQGDVP